ncbi:MAG: hypothetical protein Q9208_004464 [Pyrenodesmia sp. 3 TL-2023]
MAKANRRAEGDSQVSSRCSSLSLAKDIADDSLISLSAIAERDVHELGGYGTEVGKRCTARSLNDTFANLAARQPPVARKEKVNGSSRSATFFRTASLPLFLSDRDSDPFTDSNLQRTLEGAISKVHKVREDSRVTTIHEKRTTASTDSTPTSIASSKELTSRTHLQTPPRDCPRPGESLDQSASASHPRIESDEDFSSLLKSKTGTPQSELQQTRDRLSPSDDSDQQGVPCLETSNFTSSRPIQPYDIQSAIDLSESFDGCRDPQSDSSPQSSQLSDIDTGSCREHRLKGKPLPHSMDLSSFASFKAAAMPVQKTPHVPAPKTPPPLAIRVPEAAFNVDARPGTNEPYPPPSKIPALDSVRVSEAGINVDVDSVSGKAHSPPLLLETTSVSMHVREVAVDTDARPVTKGPKTPPLKTSPTGYSSASVTPSQTTTLVESPRIHDVPSVGTGRLVTSGPEAWIWNRSRLGHAPRPARPFELTSRYRDPGHLYELQSEHLRRRKHPDWTQDARGRAITRLRAHPRPIDAMQEIPELGKDDQHMRLMREKHTMLMNQYTQRFYGSDLDAARDLPRAMLRNI